MRIRTKTVFIALLFILAVTDAAAGRPDYSHLSDQELRARLLWIAALLSGFFFLGIAAWLRDRRDYQPAQGRFTPAQALFSVLTFLLLLCGSAWLYFF